MKHSFLLFLLLLLIFFSCTKEEGKAVAINQLHKDSLYVKVQLDSVNKVFGRDMVKAKKLLDEVKVFAESRKLKTVMPFITFKLGRYFYNTGEYDSALVYYNKTMLQASEQKNYKLQAAAYGSMGNLYYSRGEFIKAMEVYLKDLQLLEANNDKESIGAVTGNLGLVYGDLGNYKKAMEYQLKSLEIRKELKDTIGQAQTYGNLGTIYYAEGNKRKCLEYMLKSYNMHKALDNKQGMGITLGNIGELYRELNRPDSALHYMQRGLEMKLAVQDHIGIVSSYMGLGETKIALGKTEEGKNNLLKAKMLGEKLNARPELMKIYKKLSRVYSVEKDFEKAFNFYNQHIAIKDSLFDSEKISEVNKKEMEYEFDKKDAINKAELEKQKVIRNAAIAGVFFLIIFAFVVFRNFQLKKKANIELNRQKIIIEEKQKEILVDFIRGTNSENINCQSRFCKPNYS